MRAADADPAEIEALLWEGFGDPEGIAWDIGANVGQTVPKLLNRFALVVAFEPAMESFRVLSAAWGYLDTVRCEDIALTDDDGPLNLVVAPDKIDSGQLVTENQYPEAALTDAGDCSYRIVNAMRGDTYLRLRGLVSGAKAKHPVFMKIDVEGHEDKVLEGCKWILRKYHPDLLIEIHTEELGNLVDARLRKLGYATQAIRHPHYPVDSPFYVGHFWIRAKQQVVSEFVRPWRG